MDIYGIMDGMMFDDRKCESILLIKLLTQTKLKTVWWLLTRVNVYALLNRAVPSFTCGRAQSTDS